MAVRVVDTNVFSFILRGHTRAPIYASHLTGHTLAVSFMTVAELHEWGIGRNWGAARWTAFRAMLSGYVVLPSDDATCQRWGLIRCERRANPIGVADAWVAASTLAHGADLVTHNPTDFQGITGLNIITEAP